MLKVPIKPNSWQFNLGAVMFALIGWFGLHQTVEILSAGVLTYTKKGFPPRTVSPHDGEFEFYYQVLFHFTLGAFGSLLAIAMWMVSYGVFVDRFEQHKPLVGIVLYIAFVFGLIWTMLHIFRAWLL